MVGTPPAGTESGRMTSTAIRTPSRIVRYSDRTGDTPNVPSAVIPQLPKARSPVEAWSGAGFPHPAPIADARSSDMAIRKLGGALIGISISGAAPRRQAGLAPSHGDAG